MCQANNLPPWPLPRINTSTCSGDIGFSIPVCEGLDNFGFLWSGDLPITTRSCSRRGGLTVIPVWNRAHDPEGNRRWIA